MGPRLSSQPEPSSKCGLATLRSWPEAGPSHTPGLTEQLHGGLERALDSKQQATGFVWTLPGWVILANHFSLGFGIPIYKTGFLGESFRMCRCAANLQDSNLVHPPPPAWLQPVQMPKAVGWGKALPHWGAAGTWGAERGAPNPQGSAANEGEFTFSLYMGAGFKPPHLLALNKCLRKSLCGCPTQRGAGPSTWQPSRVVTEGGWFQPPRAVSMVTGTEPSWAFEERS